MESIKNFIVLAFFSIFVYDAGCELAESTKPAFFSHLSEEMQKKLKLLYGVDENFCDNLINQELLKYARDAEERALEDLKSLFYNMNAENTGFKIPYYLPAGVRRCMATCLSKSQSQHELSKQMKQLSDRLGLEDMYETSIAVKDAELERITKMTEELAAKRISVLESVVKLWTSELKALNEDILIERIKKDEPPSWIVKSREEDTGYKTNLEEVRNLKKQLHEVDATPILQIRPEDHTEIFSPEYFLKIRLAETERQIEQFKIDNTQSTISELDDALLVPNKCASSLRKEILMVEIIRELFKQGEREITNPSLNGEFGFYDRLEGIFKSITASVMATPACNFDNRGVTPSELKIILDNYKSEELMLLKSLELAAAVDDKEKMITLLGELAQIRESFRQDFVQPLITVDEMEDCASVPVDIENIINEDLEQWRRDTDQYLVKYQSNYERVYAKEETNKL